MITTDPMPVIFTAQSKRYFYCRNAVCEFVFRQGAVPVNPFRAFEYYLDERVDRDLVRRANNNLLRLADELWVFGTEIANGVIFEIFYAKRLGKPIRYFTIEDRVDNICEISIEALHFEPELLGECHLSREELLSLIADPASRTWPIQHVIAGSREEGESSNFW